MAESKYIQSVKQAAGERPRSTERYKDKIKEINKSTKQGDSILIKGSRFWQLEKIVELIN